MPFGKGLQRLTRKSNKEDVREIKSLVKKTVRKEQKKIGEKKYIWTSTNGTVLQPLWTSSVTVGPLFDCNQGVAENERIGQKIQPTSLNIRINAYRGNADSMLRIIVIRRIDPVLVAAVTTGSIVEIGNSGTLNFITAPFDLDKSRRERFQVLSDKMVLLDDGKQNGVHLNYNVKVGSKPVLFQTTITGGNTSNNIFIGFISDNALATAPNISYDIVARYKDL